MPDYGGPGGFGGAGSGEAATGGMGPGQGSGYGAEGTTAEGMANIARMANTVRDSQGNPVTSEHGPVVGGTQVANAMRDYAQEQAVRSQAIANLHSQAIATGGLPPSASSYSSSQVNAEVNSMRDRLGELAAMKDKSNEDLNEMGELNSLFGLNPTEDMGLTESLRYNVTNEDFKSDLSQLANNPLFSFASAAMGNPLGIASLIGKGIYGAVTNPVDTVTNAVQSVGDFFGGLDVQSAPAETFGGGRPDPISPLYYQTLGEEAIGTAEEDMTGVMDYAPVYYGVNNWPGAISYAKNGGLASLVPKRRKV